VGVGLSVCCVRGFGEFCLQGVLAELGVLFCGACDDGGGC